MVTLVVRPTLLPPQMRIGALSKPETILLLGVDVVYSRARRGIKADHQSFQGRSDTMMVARFDPIRNQFSVLSIPRDTQADIPGSGRQKINGANALGGPELAKEAVTGLVGIPIDHYVVLNVHGLVELVDALGGITVNIPKRMRYKDRAAKLDIDLDAGPHLLDGTQAMGFVRFRHDALGDIGRVQRQEIFLRAVMEKAAQPDSWVKVPQLIEIAKAHVQTDMSPEAILKTLTFARSVPKENQHLVMLPGHFSGTGDWALDKDAVKRVVAMMTGQTPPAAPKAEIRLSIENASSDKEMGRRLSRYMLDLGYPVCATKSSSDLFETPCARTKLIVEKGNPSDAACVKTDLHNAGEIINASIGDIDSTVTIVIGDDLIPLVETNQTKPDRHKRR